MILMSFLSFVQAQSTHPIYIIEAPDGSTAMTLTTIDDETLELVSELDFYKYELLDMHTSEAVLSGKARNKQCFMNTTHISPGTYNLRFFTKNFIVTTKITLGRLRDRRAFEQQTVASND